MDFIIPWLALGSAAYLITFARAIVGLRSVIRISTLSPGCVLGTKTTSPLILTTPSLSGIFLSFCSMVTKYLSPTATSFFQFFQQLIFQ